MPKKVKKGGGKTEGERMLFLQQRGEAEEEMAKKKEEILTLFLKDKLQKDEENTAVNLQKLNDMWRSILRQDLPEEVRREVPVMKQTFERQLDEMDNTIQNLVHDLRDSERQLAQVRRAHLQQVERLWTLQDKRMWSLQQQWENGLQHLSSRFSSDRAQMSEGQKKKRTELQDAARALQRQHKDTMEEIHQVYTSGISALENLTHSREAQVEKTERQKYTEWQYRKETKELKQLKHKNQTLVQDIKERVEDVESLQDSVAQMKLETICNKREHQTVDHDINAATERLHRSTQQLNNQVVQSQKAARKQLTHLTMHSHAATKKLQGAIAKGEKVLRVGNLCRKLEDKLGMTAPLEEEEAGEVEPEEVFPELRHLNRRIKAAELQREALKKHCKEVCGENQRLKLLLRQQLDGMKVTDQHLDQSHALLTISPAPTSSAPPHTSRCHAVIEAVHAVKHSKKD